MWLHNRNGYAMIFDGRGTKMKKNDWILAGCVVLICAAVLVFRYFGGQESGGRVIVSVDGEEYGTYSLSEERTVRIGDTNRLAIKNGVVEMEWADCPDQICVHHTEISRNGESIICLPNEVVVTIESGRSSEVDAVTQ